MGKISPVSAKYIINATIFIDGVVDRPDVIGAIFGQTEGLLGADLELRELQRSGRIGRIEVNTDVSSGKTSGSIIIPSSLDKAETSIVGASLEIIQRIGPCTARIKVTTIEDVRISKRSFVVERAKELLKQMMENVMPDSQELADEVMYSVRVMEIQEYGKDRLPAGPSIDDSDEVIVVEGRADVLNLLKHGIKNSIALNGTSVPETMIELSRRKVVTVFVDGDRGGDLIIREMVAVADVDYVTRAPDGKEVEEITKKELHKALRSRVSVEQVKPDIKPSVDRDRNIVRNLKEQQREPREPRDSRDTRGEDYRRAQKRRPEDRVMLPEQKVMFRGMAEDLIGTRGAYLLDDNLNILGKVPVSELQATLLNLNSVYAIVFDGVVDRDIIRDAEKANVKMIVAMDSKVKPAETRVGVATLSEL